MHQHFSGMSYISILTTNREVILTAKQIDKEPKWGDTLDVFIGLIVVIFMFLVAPFYIMSLGV